MLATQDVVVPVAGSNQDMGDAIDQARASIADFLAAFNNPQPGQTGFSIKARFEDDSTSEHIWLSDLDFTTRPATGVVANDPQIESVSYMERVPFLPDQISDWMYLEHGRLMGGFTTRVLLRASKRGGLLDLLTSPRKM
jgi:uncharacterized protein YegJ (DUF2314 family)